jgi:hypothetical protein
MNATSAVKRLQMRVISFATRRLSMHMEIVILDDLMAQSGKDKRISDLFTKGSHHRNLSIIYIVQNIFHQGTEMRNISLNAHYIVLFKSPRDKQQISMLARQINPGKVQEFMRSYEDATSRPHGYLVKYEPRMKAKFGKI